MMGQYSAIPALLWAMGFESFHAFDWTFAGDYHRYQVWETTMPGEADLAFHREVAMLWHWRGIEGIYNKQFKWTNVSKAVLSVFWQVSA